MIHNFIGCGTIRFAGHTSEAFQRINNGSCLITQTLSISVKSTCRQRSHCSLDVQMIKLKKILFDSGCIQINFQINLTEVNYFSLKSWGFSQERSFKKHSCVMVIRKGNGWNLGRRFLQVFLKGGFVQQLCHIHGKERGRRNWATEMIWRFRDKTARWKFLPSNRFWFSIESISKHFLQWTR